MIKYWDQISISDDRYVKSPYKLIFYGIAVFNSEAKLIQYDMCIMFIIYIYVLSKLI